MQTSRFPHLVAALRGTGVALFLLLYVSVYIVLSSSGGYIRTQSGAIRWAHTTLPVIDIEQWQPRCAFWQTFKKRDGTIKVRANLLGYFYAPLVSLDQKFLHPTRRLLSLDRPGNTHALKPMDGEEITQQKSGRDSIDYARHEESTNR